MSIRANYFKIGIFVIGAATIAVVGIIALGAGAFLQRRVLVETYHQDSVQGLEVGSPVKFRGVNIGRVEEITLARKEYPTDSRLVLVRMALRPENFRIGEDGVDAPLLQREIEQGLRVRLGFVGVTGAAYIEADYLDPERFPPLEIEWQPRYPYIPSAPSLITRIGDAVDGILRNLEAINIQGLAGTLERTMKVTSQAFEDANVEALSAELQQFIQEMRGTNRRLEAILRDRRLDSFLTDAGEAAAGARRLMAQTEEPLEQFATAIAEAATSLERTMRQIEESGDLPAGLAHLNRALRRLDALVAGRQHDIEAAAENLRRFSEDLRRIGEDARRYPSRFLFGDPPPRAEGGRQ